MQRFGQFPLLRLVVPFVIGILVYIYFPSLQTHHFHTSQYFIVLLGIWMLLIVALFLQYLWNIKTWISIITDINLFINGYVLCIYQDVVHHPQFLGQYIQSNTPAYIIVKPIDVVVHQSYHQKIVVQTYQLYDVSIQEWRPVKGNLLLYISSDINVDSMYHPNKFYLLRAILQKTVPPNNPYIFNYATYLKRHGIYFTAFIHSLNDFQPLSIKNNWSVMDLGLYVRYKIVQYFQQNSYLSKRSKNIASALLTGFDDELDNETMYQFAQSGTLHILSVSGFHTGLLFLMISFIWNRIDPYKRWRWGRIVSIIGILLFYAFIAGFAAPIVRAAIMLSLLVIQQYFYTDRMLHPLNVLSAALFAVLLYNPLYINDIGFLLSFSAMIGLEYFSPQWHFQNQILQNIWNMVSMSIGAQLATLPITLYYFHSFAFLFIIANIVIIPLASIIMFVCILALIPLSFLSIVLNYLIEWMLFINEVFTHTHTYYNWIHFNWIDAVMLSIIIALFGIYLYHILNKNIHWTSYFRLTLFLLWMWLVAHEILYFQETQKHKLSVYSDKNSLVAFIQKNNKIIFNSMDDVSMNKWARQMLLIKCIRQYEIFPFNYVQIKQRKILFCHQLKDTILIQHIHPHIIFWNHPKEIHWKRLNYPELEKIYHLVSSSQKNIHHSFDKLIRVNKNDFFIEIE